MCLFVSMRLLQSLWLAAPLLLLCVLQPVLSCPGTCGMTRVAVLRAVTPRCLPRAAGPIFAVLVVFVRRKRSVGMRTVPCWKI